MIHILLLPCLFSNHLGSITDVINFLLRRFSCHRRTHKQSSNNSLSFLCHSLSNQYKSNVVFLSIRLYRKSLVVVSCFIYIEHFNRNFKIRLEILYELALLNTHSKIDISFDNITKRFALTKKKN